MVINHSFEQHPFFYNKKKVILSRYLEHETQKYHPILFYLERMNPEQYKLILKSMNQWGELKHNLVDKINLIIGK